MTTTMDPTMLTTMFQPVLDIHLEAYGAASEILADDATGGNRRTVAKAVAEQHGVRDDFVRRVIDAIVREARPKDDEGKPIEGSQPDVSLLFHLFTTFDRVLKDHEAGKAVDAYVTAEVAKLKKDVDPDRKRASADEQNAAREAMVAAYEGIESVRSLVRLSAAQFGQDAVDNFLAQIPSDITKPRKPSGPTGPRLRNGSSPKAKYEFFDGTNNLGNQLSKVAAVLNGDLSAIKDGIAAKFVAPQDDESDEDYDTRVKAWFNAAPDNFDFVVVGEKDGVETRTTIRAVVTKTVSNESSEDSEDEDAE